MALFALIIGVILIVAAMRNSQGALFTAIGSDAPAFITWGTAIMALGAIGFIPGLKPVSRWLLALVIVVLVINNYQKLQAGFTNAWKSPTTGGGSSASGSSSSSSASSSATSGIAGYFARNGIGQWAE